MEEAAGAVVVPARGRLAVETWGLTKTFTGPPPEEQQSWADAVVAGAKRLFKPPATKTVLDGIDLSVRHGEFFGIIGSNGAGKTTFLKLLNCMLYPDAGGGQVNGHDLLRDRAGVRRSSTIALAAGYLGLLWQLTGHENLLFRARMCGLSRAEAVASVRYVLDRLEIIMSSPLRLPVFITGISAGAYVDALIRCAIFVIGGALFFGFTWPSAPAVLPLLAVLLPGLAACTGVGLVAASTVYTLDARGGSDPIRFVVETVAGLVAGVYFPLQVLPAWAQWAAHAVPHTYAIDGARRALFGSDTIPLLPIHERLPLPPLAADVAVLTLYAALALPLGWRLFCHGMELARSDARLSRWL